MVFISVWVDSKGYKAPQLIFSIARELGNRAGEGSAGGILDNAYQSRGHFKQALKYYNQDHIIVKKLGDRDFLKAVSISFPESSFPLTSGRKTRALGETISVMRHGCRLRSEIGWAEFGYFLCYSKMVAPRALVFRPLVKRERRLWERD